MPRASVRAKPSSRRAALAVGSRRVAQRAREELAEEVAEADARTGHAEASEASADVLGCYGIHWNLLLVGSLSERLDFAHGGRGAAARHSVNGRDGAHR